MPAGKHKSRTLRRVFVKTPSKGVVKHFRKRNMKSNTEKLIMKIRLA